MSLELHEKVNLTEAQMTAYRRGQAAHKEGKPCEPHQDEEILNFCKYFSIGESASIMLKWRDGWHYSVTNSKLLQGD